MNNDSASKYAEPTEPPTKRPRLDPLPEQRQLTPITHDNDIWFEDGNVVLVCKNIGFRVHSSVLSVHCQVFKDMLSTGSPAAGEMHEGADVIRLSDHSSSMRFFLSVLYYRVKGPMRAKLSINDLLKLLQLSKKYMADNLQRDVSEHLRILYPRQLSDYNSDLRKFLTPSESRFNHYDAILIADRYDLPIILPCALYLASRRGLQDFLDTPNVPSTVARRVHLFREAFSTHITDLILDDYWFSPVDCQNESSDSSDSDSSDSSDSDDGCQGSTHLLQQVIAEAYRTFSFDIFKARKLEHVIKDVHDLCSACKEGREGDHKNLQNNFWNHLPKLCSSNWKCWKDVRKAQSVLDKPEASGSATGTTAK